MATLDEFLRSGKLGPICLGMTDAEVKGALGPPQRWSGGKHPTLGYGAVLFVFKRNSEAGETELRETLLSFDPQAAVAMTPSSLLPLEDYPGLSSETSLGEVCEFLRRVGLWEATKHLKRDEEMEELIIPPPGATLTFHGRKLHSVDFSGPTPPTKQISVTVPQGSFNQLKELAHRQNKSVAVLCAEWIVQRAGEQERTPQEVGSRS